MKLWTTSDVPVALDQGDAVRQDIFRLRLAAKADALNGTAADEGPHERLERFRRALTLLDF